MRHIALVAGLLIALSGPALADVETGLASFGRGDFEAALRELEPVAEQGDPRAQYVVGVIYLNGVTGEPDAAAAAAWLRRAAEQDYVEAQSELARMYRIGDGVPQDYVEMAKWYLRAAEAGDVGTQLFIADSYAYGYGVDIDDVKAYMWYEIAIAYWGPLAVRARDVVAERMTPEQIAQATTLAQDWLKRKAADSSAAEAAATP